MLPPLCRDVQRSAPGNRRVIVRSVVLATCALPLLAGWPGDAAAQAGATTTGPAFPDEIVVTARKREESLQKVPISITQFDVEALAARNIQSIYDIATFTPNFSFNRNGVGRRLDAPSMRGQFTPLANFGTEGNVAVYVDGVYVSGTAGSLSVDNVERIEVLKGPQAALFGRAAFAGAVNYITRRPTRDFQSAVDLKAGEERDYEASMWASGPLVGDSLLFMVSAGYEQFDGEWQNTMVPCSPPTSEGNCTQFAPAFDVFGNWQLGEQPSSTVQSDFTDLGGESGWNVTGKLQWNATEALTFTAKAEYTESDDEHFASLLQPDLNCTPVDGFAEWFCGELKPNGLRAQMNLAELKTGAVSTQEFNGAPITAAPAPFIGTRTENTRYLGEAVWAAEWTFTGRASYNEQTLEAYRDLDRSPYLGPLYANLFTGGELQKWDDHSVELRADSPADGRLRGTAGLYYYDADQLSLQREFTGFCNRVDYGLPLINGKRSWNLNAEKRNRAVFAGVDYDLLEDVTLSAEARYAKDSPTQRASNGVTATENFYSVMPRFTIAWQATEDVNIYGNAAKGAKPGGFFYGYFDAPVTASTGSTEVPGTLDAIESGDALIREEKAWTYELGAKTRWLDRRVTANVALYYIDWTNQAVNEVANIHWTCADTNVSAPVANNFVRNAGESRVVGAEAELLWQASDALLLGLTWGMADTRLEEYDSLVLESLTGSRDASGKSSPRVPKHTVTASATWTRPFGSTGAEWFLRGDYIYNSKSYVDVDNYNWTGPLNLANTRFGVQNDRWTATVYIDNLTDDDTPLLASEFPNFADFPTDVRAAFHLVPRRGRNAGIRLQMRF